jgi:TIR domain-containing protein
MDPLPVDKRTYRVFLSHSHKDKEAANRLCDWLKEIADIPVWYDSDAIFGGDDFIKNLQDGIPASRGLLLLWSANSAASQWVQKEMQFAMNHEVMYPQFRTIIVRLDETPLPGFWTLKQAIDMPNGEMSLEFCRRLLRALYPGDITGDLSDLRDIYVSYGWHESEQPFVRYVSRYFVNARFRLIGDAKDQPNFKGRDDKERIREIISSCTGFLAIVPYRPEPEYDASGHTSKYIIREIDMAAEAGVPIIIIQDPNVMLPQQQRDYATYVTEVSMTDYTSQECEATIQLAIEEMEHDLLKAPKHGHYVFYATDIGREVAQRNKAIREVIQRVTGMPCKFGDVIHERSDIYRVIIDQIKGAFLVIADLTDYRPNILIEAGIAIGADVHIFYVQTGDTHRPPVMLGSPQIRPYEDETELVGKVHSIIYPYRRAVLNLELTI